MNTKERLERFLSDTPIKPVTRTHVNGVEVYVADGFVTPEMYLGLDIKFAASPERWKYPSGCYATVWMAEGNPAAPCGVGYFEPLHDIDSVSLSDRQTARVNSVIEQVKSDPRLKAKH